MVKVAIDKNSIKATEYKGYEFIYLFEEESIDDLIKLNLHCVKYDRFDDSVDINLTKYKLDSIKDAKIEDKEWYKIPEVVNYKIAIIVPNFNYEDWLDKCIGSILKQTYTNYEIIFVDDVSTDNSVEIVKQIKDKNADKTIKIIPLKQKRLNGGSRNEAYLYVSEDVDYIYYIDSDDWLYNEYALENINRKLQKKPDVLFVGMADYIFGKYSVCFIPNYKDKYEAMEGWSGSCGKVIKKELATRQECLYPEGTLKEDRNQHRRICYYMKSFDLLKKPIYVWNKSNRKSVTTIRDKIIWGTSTIRHYADLKQFALTIKGNDERIDNILDNAIRMCEREIKDGGDRQW